MAKSPEHPVTKEAILPTVEQTTVIGYEGLPNRTSEAKLAMKENNFDLYIRLRRLAIELAPDDLSERDRLLTAGCEVYGLLSRQGTIDSMTLPTVENTIASIAA